MSHFFQLMRASAKPLLKTFRDYYTCQLPDIRNGQLPDIRNGMVKCHQCLTRFHWSSIQADKDTLLSTWYCSACIKEHDGTN